MTTALADVRVFDGQRFGDPSDLSAEGGVITGISPAPGGSGKGGFVLPGLIDCHVHLSGPDTQTELTHHGVTTALDMGSPSPLVTAMRNRPGVTDIRSSMMVTTSPASEHAKRMAAMPGAGETHVAGVADAEAAVARRAEQGADYLKIVIDLPGFDLETVSALVAAAHARSLRVVAHASRLDAVLMAADAGVDVLTHVPMDRPLPSSIATELAERGAVLVPTLTMMKAIADRFGSAGGPGPSYQAARESVAVAHAAGLPILAGTDANATAAAPASPPFGASLHDELELLVDAGLGAVDALTAATAAAATHFGLTDRGRIAPGLRADLVVLAADPISDIAATRSIREVWIGGERVRGSA